MSQIGDAVIRRDTNLESSRSRARKTRSSARSAVTSSASRSVAPCRRRRSARRSPGSRCRTGCAPGDRRRPRVEEASRGRRASASRRTSSDRDQVEVEIALPRLILRGIDLADRGVDADRLHVLDPGRDRCGRSPRRRPASPADSRSPLSLTTKLPDALPAGFGEQLRGLRRAACGRGRSRPTPAACTASPKASGGSSAAQRLQQRQFLGRGQPFGLEVRSFEARLRALVGAVEQRFAASIRNRSTARSPGARARPGIARRRWLSAMACIDGRFSPGNSRLTTLPACQRREIVAGRPDARGEFLAEDASRPS